VESRLKTKDNKFSRDIAGADKAAVKVSTELNATIDKQSEQNVDKVTKTFNEFKRDFYKQFQESQKTLERDIEGANVTHNSLNSEAASMTTALGGRVASMQKALEEAQNQTAAVKAETSGLLQGAKDTVLQVDTEVPALEAETQEKTDAIFASLGEEADAAKARFQTVLTQGDTKATAELGKARQSINRAVRQAQVNANGAVHRANVSVERIEKINLNVDQKLGAFETKSSQLVKEAQTAASTSQNHMQDVLNAQQIELQAFDTNAKDEISAKKTKLESNIQALQDRLDQKIQSATEKVTGKVDTFASGVQASADGVVNPLKEKVKVIHTQTRALDQLLNDAEASQTRIKQSLTAAERDMDDKVKAGVDASSAAAGSALSEIEMRADKAGASAGEAVTAFGDSTGKLIGETSDAINSEKGVALGQVEAAASNAKRSIGGLIEDGESGAKAAAESLAMAGKAFAGAQAAREQLEANLNTKFAAVEADVATAKANFQAKMSSFGNMIESLSEEEQQALRDIQQQITDISNAVQTKADETIARDTTFRGEVTSMFRSEAEESDTQTEALLASLKGFSSELSTLEAKVEEAIRVAKQDTTEHRKKFKNMRKRFQAVLAHEMSDRLTQTEGLLEHAQGGTHELFSISDALAMLQRKVFATIKYEAGLSDIEEKKISKTISDAVKVVHYQDENAVKRLLDKAYAVQGQEEAFQKWRKDVDQGTKRFRSAAQTEFSKLGATLDMSEVAAAEERAMEEWAVKEQMTKLQNQLKAELATASAHAQARLSALAAENGKKLAALHRDATLTAAQKAKLIAKLQEEQRRQVALIMEKDAELKLEQATAARHLKVAQFETAASFAKGSGGNKPLMPTATDLESVLRRVRGLLSETDQKAATASPAAASAALAEAAPAGSLLEKAPAGSLLEKAVDRTKRALAEDSQWETRLDNE